MRRICFFAFALAMCMAKAAGIEIAPTEHTYNVHWHWGLINMNAGQAVVTYQCDGENFYGTFSGQSVNWEGRVYMVGDTLRAQPSPQLESIQYINGVYRKPKANSGVDLNAPANFKSINGQGELSASAGTIEAIKVTANIIGLYYYAKTIDFASMQQGQAVNIPISLPDGQCENLRITYNGECQSPYGQVYNITFEYSLPGEPSSYPVQCQIAADTRIPVFFSANIRIGNVQMSLI